MGWRTSHYLDPQPLATGNVFQRQAYGNYVFGVYMASAGVSLGDTFAYASLYPGYKATMTLQLGPTGIYPNGTLMDKTYTNIPVASVANITNGYEAYVAGTVCHN